MRASSPILLPLFLLLPCVARGQGSICHWVELSARLGTKRSGHATTLLGGRLYVTGGQNGGGTNVLDSVEVLDPTKSSWSAGPKLPGRLRFHAACTVSGRLFLLGGDTGGLATNGVLELVNGSWVKRASMLQARSQFAAAVHNGKIYVFGGLREGSLHLCERYDPGTNRWTSIAAMPGPRYGHKAVFVGAHAYVMGGYGVVSQSPARATWSYDPAKDAWTAHPSPASDQIQEHFAGSAYLTSTGEVILAGGFGPGDFSVHGRMVERLQLSNGRPHWVAATPLRHARAHMTATLLGADVYLVGGELGANPRSRATALVQRSKKITLSRSVEPKSPTFPLPTYVVRPVTSSPRKLHLVVFGAGLADNPTAYTQFIDQVAALGFVVGAPDLSALSQVDQLADYMLRTDQAFRSSTKYRGLVTGLPTFGGFSAGGGGAVIASTKRATKAVFALAPWTGCLPPAQRCANSPVIRAAPKAKVPTLIFANRGDPLGTASNAGWIHASLSNAQRLVGKIIFTGRTHGGMGTGRGFTNVDANTDRMGRLLQERTFRYVLSLLAATVLDSPEDTLRIDFNATGETFDVVVGRASAMDPLVDSRSIAVRAPEVFVVADEHPVAGGSLTLGFMGAPTSPYLLLGSGPRVGRILLPPFGSFLLDPGSLWVLPLAVPKSQLLKMSFPLPISLRGTSLHFQAFGLDSSNPSGLALSGWRRSLQL